MEEIRPARPEDRAAIEALVERSYGPYVERLGQKPGPMLDDYARRIANGEAWVLEIDGGVAGLLVMIERPGDLLLLDNVAVDPDRQGQGIGRRLMAFFEAEARRRGHAEVELYTHALMTENVGIYRRLGWHEHARRRVKTFDRVYMRKRLVP